jgi:hypothetical protein
MVKNLSTSIPLALFVILFHFAGSSKLGGYELSTSIYDPTEQSVLTKGGHAFESQELRHHQGGALAPDESAFFKTGTTIVGLVCRDGVVLGADTRCDKTTM